MSSSLRPVYSRLALPMGVGTGPPAWAGLSRRTAARFMQAGGTSSARAARTRQYYIAYGNVLRPTAVTSAVDVDRRSLVVDLLGALVDGLLGDTSREVTAAVLGASSDTSGDGTTTETTGNGTDDGGRSRAELHEGEGSEGADGGGGEEMHLVD